MSAAGTLIDMPAQGCGAAARDGTQELQLLEAEPVSMSINEAVALCFNDVGHLDGGPAHVGVCSFRDRFK